MKKNRIYILVILIILLVFGGGIFWQYKMSQEEIDEYLAPGEYLNVSDYDMHYVSKGEGDIAFVFITGSGTPCAYTDFYELQEDLSSFGQTITFDHAGFGFSNSSNYPRSNGNLVSDLSFLVDEVAGDKPVILICHSLGSIEAISYAQCYPERVQGIIFIDSGSPEYYVKDSELIAKIMNREISLFRNMGIIRLLDKLGISVPLYGQDIRNKSLPEEIQELDKAMYLRFAGNSENIDALTYINENARTALERSDLGNTPILVLSSDSGNSWKITQQQLASWSTNSKIVTFENSSHYLHWSNKDEVIEEIHDFLDGIRLTIVTDSNELNDALLNAQEGETILLKPGIYQGHFECINSGGENNPIRIASYSFKKAVLTIPEGSSGAALATNGCSNIEIDCINFNNLKAYDAYGILMSGGEENISINNCEFSNIVTTDPGTVDNPGGSGNAILLLGKTEKPISCISITNNYIHDNINGWAENISIAGNCERVYVYYNEIYDCTNIGIDFYGNAGYCSYLELDQPRNCECVCNTVSNCKSFYAHNAGIYVDGAYNILLDDNNCFDNYYGIEVGSEEWRDYYTDNQRVHNITINYNYLHDNEICGLRIGGYTDDNTTGVVCDCVVYGNIFGNNKIGIIIAKCDNISFFNNEVEEGLDIEEIIEYDDAISNSNIKNISFE